jgi:hypothetical protein
MFIRPDETRKPKITGESQQQFIALDWLTYDTEAGFLLVFGFSL